MSLRTKQGLQIEYPSMTPLEERPVGGMWTEDPATMLRSGVSPDMVNFIVVEGRLRKRYGYSQFSAGNAAFGSAVTGLFSTQDEENNTHLVATTPTGVKKYNQGTNSWDTLTGPALTGGATQPFSFENSQNSIVFCQGVDQIMQHVFSGTTYAVLNANAPRARYLTRFANRLMAAYTIEGGNTKPFRVRRPVADDHTNWTGIGSGFVDLSEFPHHIRQIMKIGSQMAVYTEDSLQLASRTEIAAFPIRLDVLDTAAGLFADRAIVPLPGNRHMYIGTGNVYMFNGAASQEMANPIRNFLFNELKPDAIRHYFAIGLQDTQEAMFFVSTSGDTIYPNRVWIYNWLLNIWYPWDLGTSAQPHCATLHRLDDTITIDELIGTIDEQNWEFDSRFLRASYRALLTGHNDGKVYQWNAAVPSDAGSAITSRWTSRDFTSRDLQRLEPSTITLRTLYIEGIDSGPCDLNVSFSKNGGETWEGPFEVDFTDGANGATILKFVTHAISGHRVRWKVEHTSATQGCQITAFYPIFELRSGVTA